MEAEADATPRTPLWTFGCNDFYNPDSLDQQAQAVSATGNFHTDFLELCTRASVVPHSKLLPSPVTAGGEASAAIFLQSILLDRATIHVLQHVLPLTTNLQVLKLSGCCLDVEMLGLLAAGMVDTCSIHTFHLDWNAVEVPFADAAEVKRVIEKGSIQELDDLERARHQRQSDRVLCEFGGRLASVHGSLEAALRKVAESISPSCRATALFTPVDLNTWVSSCTSTLSMPSAEAQRVFEILDCDGFIAISRILSITQEAMEARQSADDEAADPIALAFAAFVDAPSRLEVISLRYCNLGRVEAQALGRCLAMPPPHLRALNLWGNGICDRGAEALSKAFESNYCLQFLGLGRNLVTDVGLQHLCRPLGYAVVSDAQEADNLVKALAAKEKEKTQKKDKAKGAGGPKIDVNGRERYMPEEPMATCVQITDQRTQQAIWVKSLNVTLKSLVLEHNPISDAAGVRALQPYGIGDLVLRGAPCAKDLLDNVPGEEDKVVIESVRGWRLVLE